MVRSFFSFFSFFFLSSERVRRFARFHGARSRLLSRKSIGTGVPWFVAPAPYICLSGSRHLVPDDALCTGPRVHSRPADSQPPTGLYRHTHRHWQRKNDNNGSRAAPVAGISTGRFIVSPHRSTFRQWERPPSSLPLSFSPSLFLSRVRRLRFPRRVGGFRLPIPRRGAASLLSMVNSLTQPLMIHRWLFSFSFLFVLFFLESF